MARTSLVPMRRWARSVRLTLALMGGLAVLGACSANIDNRGNLPDKQKLSAVKVGSSTRGQVLQLLGSPSTVAALDKNVWYYISKKEQRYAFLNARLRDQQVIEIRFDNAGVVRQMRRYNLKDAQSVNLTNRETPTTRGEPGLIRQLYDTLTRGPFASGRNIRQGVDR